MPLQSLFHTLVVLVTLVVVGLTDHVRAYRKLLFRFTTEDSIVEWASFACLLLIGAGCLIAAVRGRGRTLLLLAIGVAALAAAGEEISWGQRVFGWEQPAFMQDASFQNETNLHNLMPAPIFNGIILLGVWLLFVAIPLCYHWRGRDAVLLPQPVISVMFLCAIAVNHYDLINGVEVAGALLILASLMAYSWLATRAGWELRWQVSLVWLTGIFLYFHRDVLALENMQYEIRELIYIYAFGFWCLDRPLRNPGTQSFR